MDWLDADPPTWRWEHDPEFRSLSQLRIIRRFVATTEAFIASSSRPNVTVAEFYGSGVLLPGEQS